MMLLTTVSVFSLPIISMHFSCTDINEEPDCNLLLIKALKRESLSATESMRLCNWLVMLSAAIIRYFFLRSIDCILQVIKIYLFVILFFASKRICKKAEWRGGCFYHNVFNN